MPGPKGMRNGMAKKKAKPVKKMRGGGMAMKDKPPGLKGGGNPKAKAKPVKKMRGGGGVGKAKKKAKPIKRGMGGRVGSGSRVRSSSSKPL